MLGLRREVRLGRLRSDEDAEMLTVEISICGN